MVRNRYTIVVDVIRDVGVFVSLRGTSRTEKPEFWLAAQRERVVGGTAFRIALG